jgi:2-phosphosulfolactate phosphatase
MRLHVALTPGDFSDAPLAGRTAFAVDVLRATTAAVAACEAGCRRLVPVADEAVAEAMAARDRAETVVAGERGGEAIAGFDLGNSPAEFTPERVGGRVVVLTTTNGTAAMLTAARAAGAALAALTNVSAAARWALRQERDVTVLCAGDSGTFALEDVVCAGLLVGRLAAAAPGSALSDGAAAALALGRHYEGRLDRIGRDSRWALNLRRIGREADLALCLRADVSAVVPVFSAGGFSAEPAAARLGADGARARPRAGA